MGFFTVIFHRGIHDRLGVKLGVNEQKIFDSITHTPQSTIAEMAKAIGISTTSIENNIKKLKDKQLIYHEGSDKSGHFIAANN